MVYTKVQPDAQNIFDPQPQVKDDNHSPKKLNIDSDTFSESSDGLITSFEKTESKAASTEFLEIQKKVNLIQV